MKRNEEKEKKKKKRRALKDTIDQYYAREMLMTLLAHGFAESEICAELLNIMKRICKEEEGIKEKNEAK